MLKLPFYDEFKRKWDSLLYTNIFDPIINTHTFGDEDQIYTQRVQSEQGLKFELHFDITHIREKYKIEKQNSSHNHFYDTFLTESSNIGLSYNGDPCSYTYYPKEKRKESYEADAVFFTMFPLVPKNFFIVDGNHRVSAFIDSKNAKTPAVLIYPEAAPVYLISSAEMAIYSFLYDFTLIFDATLANKLNYIKNELLVFNEYSVLKFLSEEKRFHGNP